MIRSMESLRKSLAKTRPNHTANNANRVPIINLELSFSEYFSMMTLRTCPEQKNNNPELSGNMVEVRVDRSAMFGNRKVSIKHSTEYNKIEQIYKSFFKRNFKKQVDTRMEKISAGKYHR